MATREREKRGFGQIRKLPSGRYQARYVGPDSNRHNAPSTYEDRDAAVIWLDRERKLCEEPETWTPPKVRALQAQNRLMFGEYAEAWLTARTLQPNTRRGYRRILNRALLPEFENVPLAAIRPDRVHRWHALLGTETPTQRAHAYGLLSAILHEAERAELIDRNPCRVRGATNVKRAHKVKPATLTELETIAKAMPDRQRLLVLLAAWCALRQGELLELRRSDVAIKTGVIQVRRAVSRGDDGDPLPSGTTVCGCRNGCVVGPPKSDAGVRDVAIPPHLLPAVKDHLHTYLTGRDGLLFPAAGDPAKHLTPSSLYGHSAGHSNGMRRGKRRTVRTGSGYYEARRQAGRDDLKFHDLRHSGATLAAQAGATLAELMGRLGHSTPNAAMRYQHSSAVRDAAIAAKLSEMAGGDQ